MIRFVALSVVGALLLWISLVDAGPASRRGPSRRVTPEQDTSRVLRVEPSRCPPDPVSGASTPLTPPRRIRVGPHAILSLRDCLSEGEAFLRVRYHRAFSSLHLHLLELRYYEGGSWLLLDDRTDARYRLAGPPTFSGDSTHFITASLDLHANYRPNRLAVWRVQADTVVEVFALDGGVDWGPRLVQWLDERTLRFWQIRVAEGDRPFAYDSSRVIVRRSEGTWHVTSRP